MAIYYANQKTLKKIWITYLGQSAECVCPQKNERQQRKPVNEWDRNEKGNNKKFRIPYNTNIWEEKVSSFKN